MFFCPSLRHLRSPPTGFPPRTETTRPSSEREYHQRPSSLQHEDSQRPSKKNRSASPGPSGEDTHTASTSNKSDNRSTTATTTAYSSKKKLPFEKIYDRKDAFFGCLHDGDGPSIRSDFNERDMTAKLKQLRIKLKSYHGIKPHLKSLIAAADKPASFKMDDSICLSFLRCNHHIGLRVYVTQVDASSPNNSNFEMYIECVCAGKVSAKGSESRAISILIRDFLIRLFSMPLSIFDGRVKWTMKTTKTSTTAPTVVSTHKPDVSPSLDTFVNGVKGVPMSSRKVWTTNADLHDEKYAEEPWYDRLVISDAPFSVARFVPPAFKDEEGAVMPKLTALMEAMKKEVSHEKLVDFFLDASLSYDIEMTFTAWNGPNSVEGCLWLNSVVVETVRFNSPNVLVRSLVNILINKFYRRAGVSGSFKLVDRVSFFQLILLRE